MNISSEAIQFAVEKSQGLADPVIVVFERVYRGWCGPSRFTRAIVQSREKISLISDDEFVEKSFENCPFPVLLESKVTYLWNHAKIELNGRSVYRKLFVYKNAPYSNDNYSQTQVKTPE